MSDPWKKYAERMSLSGRTQREAMLNREKDYIRRKLRNSLSFHTASVDGVERELAIINTDNMDTKTVIALPDEDIRHGSIIEWMGEHWLVTQKDYNTEVYSKAKMRQCNYLLKWIEVGQAGPEVLERWCIIEDGTKYLVGTYGDKDFIVTRGDSRVNMYLPLDAHTLLLNRDNRFLIDDYADDRILAYRLTKPFKLGGSYGDNGVLSFVLVECNTEDTDNLELHIADYYKYFPREAGDGSEIPPPVYPTPGEDDGDGRKWF